ncbi:hypothetical protein [Paenibacillus sp. TY11]
MKIHTVHGQQSTVHDKLNIDIGAEREFLRLEFGDARFLFMLKGEK